MKTPKLSPAQQRMADAIKRDGFSDCPFKGNRSAGRAASAWHRTADSLVRLGVVRKVRRGDGYRVTATEGGAA